MLGAALGLPTTSFAGARLSERAVALDARIEEHPGDASLYVERARVAWKRRDFDGALADLERATGLDPDLEGLLLLRGRVLADAGLRSTARVILDRHVERHPRDARARVVRARILADFGELGAAEADYDQAIGLAKRPAPELYIERARLVARHGPEQIERALAGLSIGVERLGPLVSLLGAGVEIARAGGRPVEALEWQAALARSLPLDLSRQVERAELLAMAGRHEEARAQARKVLEALGGATARERGLLSEDQVRARLERLPDAVD